VRQRREPGDRWHARPEACGASPGADRYQCWIRWRWVRADILTTGDLTVSGVIVSGEGSRARGIQRLLLAGTDPGTLNRAGVTWLVLEAGTPGDMGLAARTFERLPAQSPPRAVRHRRAMAKVPLSQARQLSASSIHARPDQPARTSRLRP
jgi:hypothetical protein